MSATHYSSAYTSGGKKKKLLSMVKGVVFTFSVPGVQLKWAEELSYPLLQL